MIGELLIKCIPVVKNRFFFYLYKKLMYEQHQRGVSFVKDSQSIVNLREGVGLLILDLI